MPPRLIVAVVVMGWLATVGWLAAEKWLPWWRPSEQPPFAIELADEVAPEHVSWQVYRQGSRAGSAETRMAPRKDGAFELTSRLRDVDLSRGPTNVRVPVFVTTRVVSRDGSLRSLEARAVLEIRLLGRDVRVDAALHGQVTGELFRGECELDTGDGKSTVRLDPIKLTSTNVFMPMQPLHKFPPLRSGQTWRTTTVDPFAQTVSIALNQAVGKKLGVPVLVSSSPTELLARVQPDLEQLMHRDKAYICRVVVYEAKDVVARTWVSVEDGRVIRQEASVAGDEFVWQRD
jgi:hypothetical protein